MMNNIINATAITGHNIRSTIVLKFPKVKQTLKTLITIGFDFWKFQDGFSHYEMSVYSIDITDGHKILDRQPMYQFKIHGENKPIIHNNTRWLICCMETDHMLIADKTTMTYRVLHGVIFPSLINDLCCFMSNIFRQENQGYGDFIFHNLYPKFYYLPTNTLYDAEMEIPSSLELLIGNDSRDSESKR